MIIAELTMPEFEAGLEKTRTVLIPFGATEEHGAHLPLCTDTLMAEEVGRKMALKRDIFIAPAVPYGVCRSTADHPGTLSISTTTLRALTLDIVDALYRQGLRCFVLITGHAGGTHYSTLLDAGEEVMRRYADVRVAVLTEYMLAARQGRQIIETREDSHAGEIETSRLLHSHPALVRDVEAAEEYPGFPTGILVRNKRRFWPGGVWGNPALATAEKGARLETAVLEALDRLVDQLERWEEQG